MKFLRYAFILAIAVLIGLVGCRKDNILTDSGVRLDFSTDTLTFDTVFTTMGSAVRSFVVYNNESKRIKISSLSIAGGEASPYRLNVDGIPGKIFTDVEVNAKDSIYIFVAVTIDPNISTNPFVVEDSVMFVTNGNVQSVVLNSWGQNAYFHYAEELYNDTIWPNDKPHVIINSFAVDTPITLTIQQGTRIYMHGNSAFFVEGTLIVNGTKQDSVVFQGDRLEPYFQDLPGNWGFLYFTPSSTNNELTHTVIKDALYGVYVDSVATNGQPKVKLHKCVIKNMFNSGIRVYQGSIEADNCLIYNCGDYCVEMFNGGTYNFKHCTFANFGSVTLSHQKPCIVLTNYYVVNNVTYPSLYYATNSNFTNCIIYGGLESELAVDNVESGFPFNYNFKNCLIWSNEDLSDGTHYQDLVINQDPMFVKPADETNDQGDVTARADYHLLSGSPAIDTGIDSGVYEDLDDNLRSQGGGFDIGCYEQ